MKNKILAILAFISIATSLQASKGAATVGYVRLDYMQSLLPEYKAAEVSYESFLKQVEGPIKDKYEEVRKKLAHLEEEQENISEALKSSKLAEIQQLFNDAKVLERLAVSKQAELFDPVNKKIQQAVEKVAQERECACVLVKNESVVYVSEECDISDLVLETLGAPPAKEEDTKVSSTQEEGAVE
ncbi:MAG: OmpH family outer membrane protein [Bacteroidota bacterium]